MKKFISFPKIGQYNQIIRNVATATYFVGVDENGDSIFDKTRELPTLTFSGTVKLHGTNAGVSYNTSDGLWAQSRKRIITTDKDNAGFALFVEQNKNVFFDLFKSLDEYIKTPDTIITIFGEWAGGNIQSGVGISGIPKFFAVFAVKISITDEETFFITPEKFKHITSNENQIFNVQEWETWDIDINFNSPGAITEYLTEVTEKIEKACPVAKAFGKTGIGEGAVYLHQSEKYGTLRFKVKGEKHSSSKVKKLVSISPEVLKSIDDFVEYAVTENRLNQGIEVVFTQESLDVTVKHLGNFIKWISGDIAKEEIDTLSASGLEFKHVSKSISNKTRKWFFEYLNKNF